MNDLIQLGLFLLSIFSLTSLIIWPRIKLSWLQQVVRTIIISLPFERIPSLEIAGVSLRISQILVLVGVWFFFILLAKNDSKITSIKIKKINIILFSFLIASIPSFFAVVNQTRFLTTLIATLLAFGATFLISQFEVNPFKRVKELTISLTLVSIFGAYQFIGDLLGIPFNFTGLREQYTKIVFGIPRIQATALEPLYFAGMLFLPIFASLIFTSFHQRIIPKIKPIPNILTSNTSLFIFLTIIFLATYSKAAIIILVLVLILLLIFLSFKVNTNL
ncbi:MAG: hypothetical protein HC932_06125 [Thermales bacterium]|nr:hypothetical protein [Thermales bacterium]